MDSKTTYMEIQCMGVVPAKQSVGACAYDLICNENVIIPHNTEKLISTGTYMAIPNGYYGKIESRSSIASKMNCHVGAGVIDADYRGEIKVLLCNRSSNKLTSTISNFLHHYCFGNCFARIGKLFLGNPPENAVRFLKGDRIAQLIILKHESPIFITCDKLPETVRGDGGFGSTGR